ncbi:MAG: universal stress protein [Alphaproteobacteria bacterium]
MVGKSDCRKFLCVVDDSEELEAALLYAAKRAKFTGGKVALFYCVEPKQFQHWVGVGRIMEQEAEEDAQMHVDNAAKYIRSITGEEPIQYIRNGKIEEELLAILSDPSEGISTLVLAIGSAKEGPGPLITQFISKRSVNLPVPVALVPQHLSAEEIDNVTGV